MSPSMSHPIVTVLVRAVAANLNAVVAFARAAWKARRHRHEVTRLLALEDHALADIGLTRGDVAACLSSPLFEDPSTRLRILAVERRAGRRAQALERAARDVPAEPASIRTRLSA
jgi:uncharacterized protein YjiS (DUF1127 family)